MSEQPNPYAAPKTESFELDELSDFDAIRREHIRYETFVRATGIVFYFLGGLMLSGFFVVLAMLRLPGLSVQVIGSGVFAFALIGLGFGLRHLKPWARFPAIFLCIVGMFMLPGTLLSAAMLFILVRRRHNIVFTSDYADICRQTPDVRYALNPLTVAILFLLVNGVVVGCAVPLVYYLRTKAAGM